ncbi:solute carrier family 12 member 6 isoform X2 [Brachionus plicatilis]|uniref:Solute carrier family 12 member 6 isoform X2 n=1 Tax=Brachionus plicatilis TaxID=10195 RepID=A0A3M7QGZ2_BRAPC|nr:solute carrier family 12 member 6 isoform X2 [Brachionus plicatilis]
MSAETNDLSVENDVNGLFNPASKNLEFYEGFDQKPVANFLSSILNFDSVIPSSKINDQSSKPTNKLGTVLGVFFPCVQNIFGVIIFIRASWIVGIAGAYQASLILLLCFSCTLLTAISTSAIATNGIVPAGGPYFMISRALGPEFGGAVGILFYLGNTVAGSMYIVGAVEIFLKYMFPQFTLIGDIENQSDAFQNFRIYGSLLLIIIGTCVFIGIKFVSKLAPVSLIAVILSILCIYIGVIKSAFFPPNLPICVFNETRLIRYESYVIDEQSFCHNQKNCMNTHRNESFICPLWKAYCGPYYDAINGHERRALDKDQKEYIVEDFVTKKFGHLCRFFEMQDSVKIKQGIPGMSSSDPILTNYKASYLDENEVFPGEKGLPEVEILNKELTSFLILIGIYFPSVTGIMAGSNRSGDLKDPSKSIPQGTIAAVLITSFIYLSNVFTFAACVDGLLLRDKFGDSIDKKLLVAVLAWPNKWVIMVGAFFSTFGAGLQSLTGAPRLLQAIASDEIIPFLKPLSQSHHGEPLRASIVTLFFCWCGILLGNVDYLTPLITMFFLICYGFVNMACALQTLLKTPNWRPRYKYYHWSLSVLGLFLCLIMMFIVKWFYALIAIFIAIIIYKYIEFKGCVTRAEKEWGDGIQGFSMSAARFALQKLEESPPHVKNWRPQILLLVKCILQKPESLHEEYENLDYDIKVENSNSFAFASQLRAGKGLFVTASVIQGDYLKNSQLAKACKNKIEELMDEFKIKGFSDCLVARNIEDGICHLIQNEGLGGLRPNTILINWPENWKKDLAKKKNCNIYTDRLDICAFMQMLRFCHVNHSAVIITKGVEEWPCDSKHQIQHGTIDLWWIIHDGGLLLLTALLLKNHKIWQKCKLRVFTIATEIENCIQIKDHLIKYMYHLRIDAEVDVIEMKDAEISAYTYEKTVKLQEREELIKKLNLNNSGADSEPQLFLEMIRRNSTFNKVKSLNMIHETRKTSIFYSETLRKMHSAIELNKKILDKSKDASLVLMNIPAPPKDQETGDYSYFSYINAVTDGLNRTLLIRGSGSEVITIFS